MARRKKGPYDECVWEFRTTEDGQHYIITTPSYENRSEYRLWREVAEGEWTFLGAAKTPPAVYKKYHIER